MSCVSCGHAIPEGGRFCPACGYPTSTALSAESATRLSPQVASTGAGQRTPASAVGSPSSGWLTASDSISHGRFAPGALFDARYRIVGLLGKGGMGEVYRADDLRLGQPVALKLLPENLRHDQVRLAQFHNEVRTARQVSHPNVCRVYDIGEADGLLYISMEYVDGEDLATSLRRIGRFPEDKALDLARQLCAGLAAAHQRGVIHRDLKPANVMLDGSGRVRIMDFGLAAIGQVEDIRSGTPAYMAPEQLLGREVTVRSDIFALGLVLYELFTGRRAFTAATIGELVAQHESRSLTRPGEIVGALDPGAERAILRCLETDPERRPVSALAVSAALPGGDPLAAALAAGETPSPEMVAAAGEGVGLSPRTASAVLVFVVAGIAVSFAMALRTSPLERMHPQYTAEVLAQKARDVAHLMDPSASRRDEEHGFRWNTDFLEHVHTTDKPAPDWKKVLSQRPSPLEFWYRQSPEPLTGLAFHTDLLTPGIVLSDDPPPITSGMSQVDLDHEGRLLYFERVPAQRQDAPVSLAPVDWAPLFALAGLDLSQFKPVDPLWNWLAGSDTRAAWAGTWPQSGRPLRVEAAALGGHPVAFMLVGPWRKPWRVPDASGDQSNWAVMVVLALALSILAGAGLLARKNVREGRGDRHGATRVAVAMMSVLMALWAMQVHLVASLGLPVMFLLAICTSVFYGALLWTMYVALEPSVRKHWPHVLVSWTNVLTGHARDAVVGRDVLIGTAVGVAWAIMIRGADSVTGGGGIDFPGSADLLSGLRTAAGVVLQQAPYAMRNAFVYLSMLFVARLFVRREWVAALIFAGVFTSLDLIGNDEGWSGPLLTLLYFGSGAFVLLRWGLLAFAVAVFVAPLLLLLPATTDSSAWFFGNMMLVIAAIAGLAIWGLYTSVSRQVRMGPRAAR